MNLRRGGSFGASAIVTTIAFAIVAGFGAVPGYLIGRHHGAKAQMDFDDEQFEILKGEVLDLDSRCRTLECYIEDPTSVDLEAALIRRGPR